MRILSWMASESCACLPVLCALPNTVKRNDKEVKVIYENKCLWMSDLGGSIEDREQREDWERK